MKILKLDLRAFGPFTDVTLDLSAGSEGLHVIYGPNEAGKSSTLRALTQLLFGIPGRSEDNFVHPHDKLRIGATLHRRDGTTLQFLRRKGAKKTLLDADNATHLDESALEPFLGGLDKDLFATMFGIGHATLVEGGQDIVRGRGDVGQLLFAAGAGLSHLRKTRDDLEGQCAELFKPRGQTQRINQRLRALDDAKSRIRQAQLHGDDWVRNQKDLEEVQSQLGRVETDLQQAQRERHRLDRIRQALPIIARRKQCCTQREGLGPVRILPSDFAERRRETVTSLTLARTTEQNAAAEIDRIDEQLRGLVIPEAVLDQSQAIERLFRELESHRKADRDLPGLQASRAQVDRDAAAILRDVRPDLTLEAADRVRLTRVEQLEIQNLGSRHAALLQQGRNARTEIEQSGAALEEAEKQLAGLEKPRDAAALKAAIRRIQGQGDLEQDRDRAARALGASQQQTAIDLGRLPLWSGALEQLEAMSLPAVETVDRFEVELGEADGRVRLLEERLSEAAAGRDDVDRQIEQHRLEGEVPSEADLAAARRIRDEGWQLVLDALSGKKPDAARVEEFCRRFHADGNLAAAYRRSVDAADDVADRLRREANRVATRAHLQASRDAQSRQLAAIGVQIEQACAAQRAAAQAWRECWSPLGIAPGQPREMRAWLVRQQALVEQSRAIRTQHVQLGHFDQRIAACRGALAQRLEELGEPPLRDSETLAALLERSAATADGVEAAAARRQQLDKEVRDRRSRLSAARLAAEQAEAELAAWQEQWRRAMEPLGLEPETTPTAANEYLARVGDLFARLKEARGFAERIDAIGADAESFRARVRELARKVDPALASQPAESTSEGMEARRRKAAEDCRTREALAAQHARYVAQRDAARQGIDRADAALAALVQEAGCDGPDGLTEAERASETARRLDETLESLDDQLLSLSSGAALDAFLAEAEAVPADDLPARLARLDEELQRLETERRELAERLGGLRNEQNRMDAGAAAADAAEDAQELLAQLEPDVEQYARLKLALAVLRDGIERYRRKNEGPILGRASELFGRLTLGSFQGLRADFDDHGENVLKGVRPGGADTVGLAGMSDGTGDQLYLALRLASLENYLADREPIPFVVDDVLIGFDDARSTAALEVLAEFSRRTQVIFFTHHQHLVELARATLEPDEVFVHQLGEKS